MGFPPELVTETDAVSEFLCAICVALPESPMVTSCSHVFCAACIDEWMNGAGRQGVTTNNTCPTCKAELPTDTDVTPAVQELRVCNPLAWRVLARTKLKCPLHAQGCDQIVEFSELQSHLASPSLHKGENTPGNGKRSAEANAVAIKDQGNAKFEARKFTDAIALYTKAISVCPTLVSVWSNRAAAYLMLGELAKCVADCNTVIKLDPAYTKAYVRKAKALVEQDRFREAVQVLSDGRTAIGAAEHLDNRALAEINQELAKTTTIVSDFESAKSLIEVGRFSDGRSLLARLLRETNSVSVVLWTAKAAVGLGQAAQALRLTLQVLRRERTNLLAYVIRAEAMHHAEQLEDGIKLVREALRLDPDYTQAKTLFKALKGTRQSLAAAATAEQQRDFETAKAVYTSLIDAGVPEAAPLYASLYSKRGNAHCRLQDHEAALRDCAKALYVKDDCKSAWLTRRLSLHALGRHEEAFNDMKGLMQRWGQTDTAMKHAYHKAEFELRKSKRVDYYSLLNCRKLSSEGEIKQAYKVKAMECHPDKHGDKTPAQQKEMENKFKVLGEALEILTTPMKRQLYDEGYDKEAIDERAQAAQRAAHKDGSPNGHGHGHG